MVGAGHNLLELNLFIFDFDLYEDFSSFALCETVPRQTDESTYISELTVGAST